MRRMLLLLLLLVPGGVGAGPNPSWQLLYSSDFHGELKPCGCSAEGDLGGILRRASKLQALRSAMPDTVTVSAGDILGETDEQGQIKNRFMLQGQAALALDAIVPGERDLAAAPNLVDDKTLPWVLTNGVAGSKLPRFRSKLLPNGVRVIIAGILEPENKVVSLPLADPTAAINDLFSEIRPGPDTVVVLLVHGRQALAEQLASDPRIHVVVRGHLDAPVAAPKAASQTKVLAAGHRGQRLGIARFEGNRLTSNQIVTLPKKVPDDPQLAQLYQRYDEEIVKWFRAKTLQMKQSGGRRGHIFATDKVCAQCHVDIHRQWAQSKHARAYPTLRNVNKHEDPECLRCHTTGLGSEGGFVAETLTPELVNVQCEACHGAARKHAEYPRVHKPWTAKSACIKCHTRENSPSFNYSTYWPKIRHQLAPRTPIHRQPLSRIKGLYNVLDPIKPLLTDAPIVVTEYFNFYCSRCYILDRSWPDMIEFLQKPIAHRQVPIVLGDDQKPWAAIAYLVAANAGKGKEFKHALFKARFEDHLDLDDAKIIVAFAGRFGLQQAVETALGNPSSKAAREYQVGMARRKQLNIDTTPTLVINDNLMVLSSHTGNNTELQLENTREILLDMQCRQSQTCDL